MAELKKLSLKTVTMTLIGDTPLIMHKWDEKAKKAILDKQKKKAKKGHEARDPQAEFEACIYYKEDGSYGFPAIAFKASAVRAGKGLGFAMTDTRVAFHINEELVSIKASKPSMREDMVRLSSGTSDLRFRPEFFPWSAKFEIVYNSALISEEQIINLFENAGFGVGIGEWRPERDGNFGRFHVELKKAKKTKKTK